MSLGFGRRGVRGFSLQDPESALISNDWVVGLNTTASLVRGRSLVRSTTKAATWATISDRSRSTVSTGRAKSPRPG